jgi:hypothetical protein
MRRIGLERQITELGRGAAERRAAPAVVLYFTGTAGAEWIRTFSSGLDRQQLRIFVRVGADLHATSRNTRLRRSGLPFGHSAVESAERQAL